MAQDDEIELGALTRDLARLQRRAARQKRSIGSRSDAWRNWSATMDEIVSLTERLIARSGSDLEIVTAKFNATLWLIEVNESLLDSGDLRRLRHFGRDLSLFADRES